MSLVNYLSGSVLLFVSFCCNEVNWAQQAAPLVQAHAHNDYEHSRPLVDALECGFCSVEADVYLVDNELLVAHNLKDIKPERTLDSLYLKPLFERFRENKGSIHSAGRKFVLLVDIKNNGEATYQVLSQQLAKYAEMLSSTVAGKFTERAVTIIISGDRPIEAIKGSNPRYVGIDGRLSDLDSDEPASLFPLISDNWRLQFRYRGTEEISADEKEKLGAIVAKAHAKGRRVRFWATPESEKLWNELRQAKVDLIGTDELRRLSNYLRE